MGCRHLLGRVVFPSFAAMQDQFPVLWNNLSPDAIGARTLQATLGDSVVSTPPGKLSARMQEYPGFWVRNRIQTELEILADLVLEDIARAPELEDEFLRRCYSVTNTLSEYALVEPGNPRGAVHGTHLHRDGGGSGASSRGGGPVIGSDDGCRSGKPRATPADSAR